MADQVTMGASRALGEGYHKHEVPALYLKKWQKTVDVAAQACGASAALIRRVWSDRLEVLVSSSGEALPCCPPGKTTALGAGLFCERVLATRSPLMVADALEAPEWREGPDANQGMLSYLGVPLLWPDKTVFGTLCLLSTQPLAFTTANQDLLDQLKEVIEGDFRILHYSRELDRRKAILEEQVAERTASLRLILDSAAEAIYGIDLDGRCTFCNQASLRILGYADAQELLGKDMHALVHHSRADGQPIPLEECRIIRAVRRGDEIHVDDEVLWRKDGTSFPAEYWSYPQRKGDRLVGAVITCLDITERKRAEQEIRRLNAGLEERVRERTAQLSALNQVLNESELRLKQAQQIGRVGSWEWVLADETICWSDELYELLGLSPEAAKPSLSLFLERVHPEDRERLRQRMEDLRLGKAAFDEHYRLLLPDGSIRLMHGVSERVFEQGDRPVRVIGIAQDITEQKRLEQQLREQFEQLMELDRLKSNFVNSVTHELRTPLTSIRGYSEFLADELGGSLTPLQRSYVTEIERGALRLELLLDDLLDFARIEAGTFRLMCQEADFYSKVDEIVESLQPLALQAQVRLERILPPEPLLFSMDARRIGQVLLNLINNALKFTPPGGRVQVRTRIEGEAVRCEVEDTGEGIAPEDFPKLFTRFGQLPAGLKKGSGTGLGLSISKALIEAHGGSIGVESTFGQGSVFWFTLPLTRAADDPGVQLG
ncbi:PAS domain S-box protein [bacterium]|nr:PAS domain S-box protein [bacterium]